MTATPEERYGGILQQLAEQAYDLTMIKANLASLDEIVAEMAEAMHARGMDPNARWLEVVINTMREHTWSLGFEFRGQPEPAAPKPRGYDASYRTGDGDGDGWDMPPLPGMPELPDRMPPREYTHGATDGGQWPIDAPITHAHGQWVSHTHQPRHGDHQGVEIDPRWEHRGDD